MEDEEVEALDPFFSSVTRVLIEGVKASQSSRARLLQHSISLDPKLDWQDVHVWRFGLVTLYAYVYPLIFFLHGWGHVILDC